MWCCLFYIIIVLGVLVRGNFGWRFTAGELDECDLTLRDLTRIQEAFLPILEATRHARVAYPWQQEQQSRQKVRRKQERT